MLLLVGARANRDVGFALQLCFPRIVSCDLAASWPSDQSEADAAGSHEVFFCAKSVLWGPSTATGCSFPGVLKFAFGGGIALSQIIGICQLSFTDTTAC